MKNMKELFDSEVEVADLRRRNLLGLAAVEAGEKLDPKAREQVIEALRGRSEAKVITALRLLIALVENPDARVPGYQGEFPIRTGTVLAMRSAVAPFAVKGGAK